MSRKGTKRKAEPVLEKCDGLAMAIRDSAGLPADVLKMLLEIIPHCLAQPKDKRHRFQEKAILALGDVLKGCEERFRTNIEEARAKLAEANEKTAPFEQARDRAEEKLHEDSDRVRQETKMLAKATLELRAARAALQDAQKCGETGGQGLEAAAKRKEEVRAIADLFKLLKSGSVPDADVDKHCKSVVSVLNAEFDEAMLMVLTTSLSKEQCASRGEFGQMVVDQVDEKIANEIKAQDEIMTTAEVLKKERVAALPLTQKTFEDALEAQKLRAKVFETSWEAKQGDERALEVARKDLKDLASQKKTCDRALYKVEAEFDVFQDFASNAFEELKERSTPVPVELPDVEEPAPMPQETCAEAAGATMEASSLASVVEPEAIAA